MITVVQKSEASIRHIADTYKATNFITKDITPVVSLAINEASNHQETETTDYDRIYYVVEGVLNIKTNDEAYSVNVGDACFISANTTYDFFGTFKAVVVNQPAFGTKS